MKLLSELPVKEFLLVTAGDDPVPGGGSVSALCGALSAALGQMVTNLTIGRKKYAEQEENMKEMAVVFNTCLDEFAKAIDADSNAYNTVFSAYKLPKETEREKTIRTQKIQEAIKIAAEVPFQVAQKTYKMMDFISIVAKTGNQNAVTDACVAMMCARTAVLGALLNVRINLTSIQDLEYVDNLKRECDRIEEKAIEKEQKLLAWLKSVLNNF
ncbi:MAG: cyclodeaminase/cyclohydrolase family protein [Dysgonamonadaceae bacterium]|jgi:formiminotetrahydrofolate cyclodeaminase|nr:cyclodeaminase/cyclohydrolase family protein [Dysgonamonadaceae bacterium]